MYTMESQNFDTVPIVTALDCGEHESMDQNSSGNSLSPIPPTALNPSLSLPAPVLPRISEKESQLACEVGRHVSEKNYRAAMDKMDTGIPCDPGPMTSLLELRPDDPLVAANGCFVAYMAGKYTLDEFQSRLHSLRYGQISNGANDLDDGEQCSLLYNLAMCCFRKREFRGAENILKKLYHNLNNNSNSISASYSGGLNTPSPLGSSQGLASGCSNFPSQDAEICQRLVLPLLVSNCLALDQPSEAICFLNEITSTNSEAINRFQVLARARALVQLRQHKIFKRDIKPVGIHGNHLTAYEFLRSNLEYLKGNHRKSLKLLGLAIQQHQNSMSSSQDDSDTTNYETTQQNMNLYISSLYTNNMGCINLMLGKPNHGVLYFERALTQHTQCITSDLLRQRSLDNKDESCKGLVDSITCKTRKDVFLRIKQNEIAYNLGIALLHAGKSQKAFDALVPTIAAFGGISASLWLHLAECCITSHGEELAIQRGETSESDHMKHLCKSLYDCNKHSNAFDSDRSAVPVVKLNVLGYGDHRKVVIANSSFSCKSPKEGVENTNHASLKPRNDLDFAYYCLKNALMITEKNLKSDMCLSSLNTSFIPTPSSSLSKPGSTTNSSQSSPIKTLPLSQYNPYHKWQMLRASVLLNMSYVSLCLSDPVIALESAQKILSLDMHTSNGSNLEVPGGYKILAQIYAADALIQLDRISEAIEYLDPSNKNLSSLDFTFSFDNTPTTNSSSADENNEISSTGKNNGKKISTVNLHSPSNEAEGNLSGTNGPGSPRRQVILPTVNAVFQYNLIVALAVRGELEKADEMTENLWKKNGKKIFNSAGL